MSNDASTTVNSSATLNEKSFTGISCLGSVYQNTNGSELNEAIASLFHSETKPAEIILVIDGPVSHELEHTISHLQLKYDILIIRLRENCGLGVALWHGVRECTHELIVRFDTDDVSLPGRLDVVSNFFARNKKIDILGSYVLEQTLPAVTQPPRLRLKTVPLENVCIYRHLVFANPINHPSVAFKKSSILAIGSYVDLPWFEDYYLWLKAKKGNLLFANIPIPLVLMNRDVRSRRCGPVYFYRELVFLAKCIRSSLLPPYSLIAFLPRLTIRLLPLQLQYIQDKLPWRVDASSSIESHSTECFKKIS